MHTSKVAPPHASKEKASLITSLAMIPPSTRSTVRTLVARRDWWVVSDRVMGGGGEDERGGEGKREGVDEGE